MTMSDTQRAAIVTGAAGGIGRALVKGLLGAGIRVAAVDLTRDGLAVVAGNAREQGKDAALLTIESDLSRDGAAADIVRQARGRFGAIDILVNNAGIGQATLRPGNWQQPLRFWDITADDWRRFVAVHTTAPLTLAQALVPEMIEKKWGRIVNVTTSLGTMIRNGSPTYGPSKAALEAFSAIMAKDLDRRHGQCAGAGRRHQHADGAAGSGLRPAGDDPAGGHGAAAGLAGVERGPRGHRAALCGGALGPRVGASAGGRKGRRASRLDQHCDDADRAAATPVAAPPGRPAPPAAE
jgi:NAD(P)-dependent dehydrogenase (short-subunit alcohol dehydrogenase family)